MTSFSFIENPIINVLTQSQSLLPGIEKVVAVYYCNKSAEVKAKNIIHVKGQESRIEEMIIEDHEEMIDRIRTSNHYFEWLKKDEIPFEEKKKKKNNQVDIFSELEKVVLSLAFLNENDKKYDILYFYFNKDMSNFGITNINKDITTENKKIIGFLLYNSVKTLIETTKNDADFLYKYNESTKSLAKRYNQVKEDLEKSKNNYGLSIVDLCKIYVKEHSDNNSRFKYKLTDDALKRIKAYQGDITALKGVINNAINYVSNLYFDTAETEINISEDHLNFESIGAGTAIKQQEEQRHDKLLKTTFLLDKLENSARDVKARNMELTGANVANACSPPITAPAISDAMKKNKRKIIELLNKYPDRWILLRTYFRPLKNLLISVNDVLNKTA